MHSEFHVHELEPVFDENSRILILGSFPSRKSREDGFYYAHPQNRFWKIMAALFDTEITDRRQFCLDHGIALWDVIASCTVTGSSDASIKDIEVNPIGSLLSASKIHTVFTTGGRADALYRKYIDLPAEHIALPSTSAANAAMSLEKLTAVYAVILEKLNEKD